MFMYIRRTDYNNKFARLDRVNAFSLQRMKKFNLRPINILKLEHRRKKNTIKVNKAQASQLIKRPGKCIQLVATSSILFNFLYSNLDREQLRELCKEKRLINRIFRRDKIRVFRSAKYTEVSVLDMRIVWEAFNVIRESLQSYLTRQQGDIAYIYIYLRMTRVIAFFTQAPTIQRQAGNDATVPEGKKIVNKNKRAFSSERRGILAAIRDDIIAVVRHVSYLP